EGPDRARLRGCKGNPGTMRMTRITRYGLIALAVVIVTLSLINVSWLAGKPEGRLTLIAHRGSGQPIAADAPADCNARHVRPGQHGNLIENSAGAMTKAMTDGA